MTQTAEISVFTQPQVTEIISQSGLDHKKAQEHALAFTPHLQAIAEMEKELELIEGETPEGAKAARELRLRYQKNRTAADKVREERKRGILNEGNLIQALYNLVKTTSQMKEDYLEKVEKYVEIQEQRKREERFAAHMERLRPFIEGGIQVADNLISDMEDSVFDHYFSGVEKSYQEKVEAERKAEEARVEQERKQRVYNERQIQFAPLASFMPDFSLGIETTEEEYSQAFKMAGIRKSEHDAEQERIRIENERLKKEAEMREEGARIEREEAARRQREIEEAARKEREAIEAKAKAEREEQEKKAAEERAARERAEAELAEKKAEEERKAREAAEQAEREAAMGDKAKYSLMIERLHAMATEYEFKSEKFKKAQSEILSFLNSKS